MQWTGELYKKVSVRNSEINISMFMTVVYAYMIRKAF